MLTHSLLLYFVTLFLFLPPVNEVAGGGVFERASRQGIVCGRAGEVVQINEEDPMGFHPFSIITSFSIGVGVPWSHRRSGALQSKLEAALRLIICS